MIPFMERHLHDLARESRERRASPVRSTYRSPAASVPVCLSLPSIAQERGLSTRYLYKRRIAGAHQLPHAWSAPAKPLYRSYE